MGALMRSHDWAHTPFGPVSKWPQSLRTALRICLDSRFPIVIWWGPELRLLYNDAWRPALGTTKHPQALGAPGDEVWADVWDTIGPMLESVMRTGKATWENDQLLLFDRHGYVEESYWTYSYSAIRLASGEVGGVFSAVHEVTDRVVSARRLKTLREVADQVVQAKNEMDACTLAMQSIVRNPADCPYAIISLCDGKNAKRVATSFDASTRFPLIIDLATADRWGIQQAVLTKAVQVIDVDTPEAFPGAPFGAKCKQALSIPILSPTREAIAVITIGISPYRAFDTSCREFLESLARNLAANINNAKAYDEERRRAEALAELDRAKTVFFSNVSHEFRTPLTLMLGPLEDALAARDELPAQHRERLEVAHRNSVRLLRLVNTLLDFSRIEAGRIQASYEPTDLSQLTSELASLFRSATDRAGLKLLIDCPAIEEPVYVDREMWEKIVFNLLSNAFKFTFAGEIEVSLEKADGHVELSVRDTGTGIPEYELPRLFERFYRVKSAHGRTFEGSGIGLALVQELAKLHCGSVRVKTQVDKGSTFTVAIPLGKDHLPADRISAKRTMESTGLRGEAYVQEALRWLPETQNESGESSVSALLSSAESIPSSTEKAVSPALILLADDNADMREYVERLLKRNYEVISVPDGESALQHARERRPDLILSDIMMPRLDGFGLLERLRADDSLKSIPVILLSARAGEESRVEGLQAGADDYLVKPFSARELLARVTSHLNMARIRRQAAEVERKLRAESEFERSQLRNLLMQAPAAICLLTGPEHCYAFANQEYLNLTGRKRPEDFVGKTVREALPEFEGQPFSDLLDQVYRTGVPHRGTEVKVMLNRGSNIPEERYHNFAYLPVAGLSSGVEGILVHVVDVTSEVLARQEIEKRERQFREMIDALPAAIYTTDSEGRITHFNPAAIEFSGRVPELGTDQWCVSWKLYYPDGRPMPHDECPMAIALKEGRIIKGAEAIAERPDGTRRWFMPFPTPLRDSGGNIVGGINMLLDITERKQADEELREREAELTRDMKDLTRIQQVRTRLVDSNDLYSRLAEILSAAADLTGTDKGNIQLYDWDSRQLRIVAHQGFGKPFLERFTNQGSAIVCDIAAQCTRRMIWEDVAADPALQGTEDLDIILADGIRAIQCTPLLSLDGRLLGLLNNHFRHPHRPSERDLKYLDILARMASDFIERWQSENALRDSEQRFRMLADNLEERVRQRTMALEKAQDELSDLSAKLLVAQDEERRRIARELHDSAGQTLTILGLEIAQLSNSGKTELSAKVAGLQEMLQQLTEEIRTTSYLLHPPLLDENGITAALKWYVEGLLARTKLNISLTISEDLGRLRRDVELVVFRVVQECLTNVIRHSESKEAFVSVTEKDGTLVIAVRDSGKGIPGENIDQMQLKGFGVGIRGMRERVRQLGGTLNIESEGRGTTISVTLPVARAGTSRSQDTVPIVEAAG